MVDEDKLPVLPSKEKERIGKDNSSRGRSVSSSYTFREVCPYTVLTALVHNRRGERRRHIKW